MKCQVLSRAGRSGTGLGGSYFELHTSEFRRNAGWRESMVRNEPNLRPAEYPSFHYSIIPPFQSDAKRAKRTQTAVAGSQ